MIDSKKLRHFVALAKVGNFNAAAKALHLSQPALSRSIQSLEQELDTTLFDRSQRAIKLTPAGEHLLKYAQSVIQNLYNLSIEASRLNSLETGSLKIGTGPLPADHIAAKACAEFLKQHPKISLRLRVDEPSNLEAQLIQGDIDVLIADPRALHNTEELKFEILPSFPAVMVARAGHPLAKKKQISATDLAKFPLASISNATAKVVSEYLDLKQKNKKQPFSYECNSVQLMLTTIKHSDAIATLLSCNILNGQAQNEFCVLNVPAIDHKIFSEYSIVTYKPRSLSLAAEAFIGIVRGIS